MISDISVRKGSQGLYDELNAESPKNQNLELLLQSNEKKSREGS